MSGVLPPVAVCTLFGISLIVGRRLALGGMRSAVRRHGPGSKGLQWVFVRVRPDGVTIEDASFNPQSGGCRWVVA